MTRPRVLYAGDTSLDGAAAYLAAMMTRWDIAYRYVPSDDPLTATHLDPNCQLFVFSDYAAANAPRDIQVQIVERVHAGAGLLMIGGWESFHGSGGLWHTEPVGDVVPVEIAHEDDRINCDQPTLVHCAASHAITEDLPWNERPPTIGGFNRFVARPDADVLLETKRFAAHRDDRAPSGYTFSCTHSDPLLVVGRHGRGRTAALATDVAPHWVGGWVDWGPRRYVASTTLGHQIEVGHDYARFFHRLLRWTSGAAIGRAIEP